MSFVWDETGLRMVGGDNRLNKILPAWLLLLLCGMLPAGIRAEYVLPAESVDTMALSVMERLYDSMFSGEYTVESLSADLYVKEKVKTDRKNLLLNIIPDMTRFDRKEDSYLAELFYKVHYMHNSLPDFRRVASLSTFGHSSGEMDLLLSFMMPNVYSEFLFKAEHFSPLSPSNVRFYRFETDTTYAPVGFTKVDFVARYDNMHLLSKGWVVVDDRDGMPITLYAEGWNEQCRFSIECNMGSERRERALVKSIDLAVDYEFAFNRLKVDAQAEFDYNSVQMLAKDGKLERKLDVTPENVNVDDSLLCDRMEYIRSKRRISLSEEDSLFYNERGVLSKDVTVDRSDDVRENRLKDFLWQIGDGALSSHTLRWGSSDLRIYPLIKPSYLSYSSSKGVTYKFSVNLSSLLARNCMLQIRPVLGYSFKLKEFYWSVRGGLSFAPMKRASYSFDVGRGNSVYSSVMRDMLDYALPDSVSIKDLPSVYYRDFHVKQNFQFEVVNGLEVQTGVNFYLRTMQGSTEISEVEGLKLKREYRQLAPHLRVTWHPGMYYYVSEGRKINIGSNRPRVSLDMERGISGLMGAGSKYLRAELDFQYKYRVTPGGYMYMRLGGGGYFRTKDVYFVSYTFLKDNHLRIDDDAELEGEFHLLDRVWYNSANKYVRANFCYSSPFLLFQKLIPSAGFIKREGLYAGALFISDLIPYTEYGYGVETPYVNIGFFVGFEKSSFHETGVEVSFSLFRD